MRQDRGDDPDKDEEGQHIVYDILNPEKEYEVKKSIMKRLIKQLYKANGVY